ncbi:MAG: glycosyltransferase [Elusimicrobia bacterium]|nr:glycosyltransferase [Elusimicrobiota bacterium]
MSRSSVAIISVIIPTYKRPRLLGACLESLIAGDLAPAKEIIVVIHDEDPDGLREALKWKERCPLIRLVYTKHASRSAARNAAISVCEGDWCYFLDDDVVVPPGTLRELEEALARHPEACAIGGPNRIPEDCGLFERCVEEVLSSRLGAGTMRTRYKGLDGETWVDERSLIACNLAVRTQALRRNLLFHPWLDYGEETHFLARLRLDGGRFLHAPSLWVYHHRRSGFFAFCQQAFRSGRGRARQTCLLPRSLSPEFLGPPALVGLAAAAFFSKAAAAALAFYAGACLVSGALTGWRLGSPTAALLTAFLLPAGHLSFGLGVWLFPFLGPSRPARPGWPARAARLALRLRAVPGIAVLYRAYYRAALLSLRLWLRLGGPPVSGVWLRRGLTRGDWTPGVSDVDLAVELPDLPIELELAWLERWQRGLGRLRRFFPILGEVQLGTAREWKGYLENGDIRSLELQDETRVLLGTAPRGGSPPDAAAREGWEGAKKALDAWSEQLHAYVRLSQLYFDGDAADLRAALNARKAALDVARYGRLLDGGGPGWKAPARADEAARLARGPWGQALARLDGAREPLVAVEDAFLLASQGLEDGARRALALVPQGAPAASAADGPARALPREERSFAALCGKLEGACGGLLTGAIHDSLEHWLLAVREGGASERTRNAWRALRALRRTESALSQAVLPLPPCAFRLALWAPFAEDPLRALCVGAMLRSGSKGPWIAASGSSPLLERHVLSLWGLSSEAVPPPPRALAEALMRESLSHVLVNWRALGEADRRDDDRHRWVYLYGRALSLRLYAQTKELWPGFPLEPLAARFSRAFPQERDWIETGVLKAAGIGDWAVHRAFFARQFREAAACLS